MAAPASGPDDPRTLREQAERLVLAALGAVSLTADRIDELGDELANRAGVRRDEAVTIVREVADGWRREAGRIGDRTTEAVFRMEEMGDEEAQAALWAGARATPRAAATAC